MSNTPVVSDKMRYGLRPVAVESKAHILTVPALGTNLYTGETSSTIIFRIQHNPSGRYIDPTATKIKMTCVFSFPIEMTPSDCFFLERGPESIIRRFTVKDIQGRVLEDIDQYNMLYGLTELCTAEPITRERRGLFTLEGNSFNVEYGGWIRHPTEGFQNSSTYRGRPFTVSFDICFTPLSGVFGGACEKYLPLSVMEGLEISLQLENVGNTLKYQFLPYPKGDAVGLPQDASVTAINNAASCVLQDGAHFNKGAFASHNRNAGIGAINTALAKFSPNVEWSAGPATAGADGPDGRATYTSNGGEVGYQFNLKREVQSGISYTIRDPKLLLSCLDVEPAVNAALIKAAQDPRDGLIRIQTFSWQTFATQLMPGLTGNYQWQIPVSVTSMKSIFFVLTDTSKTNNMNYLKTGFEHRGLLQYRVVIGGLPLNADFVTVTNPNNYNTYSEPLSALMEAWSVHHKTDGSPSLITPSNYVPARFDPTYGYFTRENSAIFGQELESFNMKSDLIQSGVNTMQTTFVLELNFAGPTIPFRILTLDAANAPEPSFYDVCTTYNPNSQYELRAFCMYDKVIAFDETSGSIRAEY